MATDRTPNPYVALVATLLLAGCQAQNIALTIPVNAPWVWLQQIGQLGVDISTIASSQGIYAGMTSVDVVFNMAPANSMLLESTMAGRYQVADMAASTTAFTASDLSEGWITPMLQFPFAWSSSEVFYHVPNMDNEPLRMDACALAGILTANITNWADERLIQLNPQASLPDLPMTLVYLNISSSVNQMLTQYLSTQCPEEWTYGVTDNLGDVVAAWGDDLRSGGDMDEIWQAVNNTRGAISIGGSMPVGSYRTTYPAAMQYAALKNAAGEFVVPSGDLNETALAELAAQVPSPGNTSQDWTFLYQTSPGVYPVVHWGLMTVPRNLTAEDLKGFYIRASVGYLLVEDENQALARVSNANELPPQLRAAAINLWSSIEVSNEEILTNIPAPTAPENAANWQKAAVGPLMLLAAAAAVFVTG